MQREDLVKEVLYRSIHRGCKETDFLIGGFAKQEIANLDEQELFLFKDLISEDDLLIYDWILQKENVPQKYQKLIAKMQEFHNLSR